MTYQRALIVDDSKLARVSLKKKLEQRGLETVMAEGAQEALDLLKTTAVDVVFMDHLMPDMDGFAATRHIKANAATSHLPVIMCSGKESEGYLAEAQAIGATNILSKPPEDATLDAILAGLEKSAMRADTATPQPVAAAANEDSIDTGGATPTADLSALISPLAAQVSALGHQLNTLSRDIEARLAAADRMMALFENSPPAKHIEEAVAAEVEARLAQLPLPSPEQIEQRVKRALLDDLRSSMKADIAAGTEQALEQGLEDAQTALQARIEAAVVAQATAQIQQRIDDARSALRAELAAAPKPDAGLAALRKSLYDDIMAELALREHAATAASAVDGEPLAADIEQLQQNLAAERQQAAALAGRVKGCQWLAALSAAMAAGAIALHWVV